MVPHTLKEPPRAETRQWLALSFSWSDKVICTKPLRQTLRVRYFRDYGLPQPPESLSAFRL
jgi:hypothetical protein